MFKTIKSKQRRLKLNKKLRAVNRLNKSQIKAKMRFKKIKN
jgi:hypothetical protein